MPYTIGSPATWIGFVVFVLAMLALDLGVFHRKAHDVRFREAAIWTCVWIALAFGFAGILWWRAGADTATDFVSGYLIEKSLSVDNLFVFVVVFGALRIPPVHQHRVLFWGILSALVLRAIMIFAGTALLARFHWLIFVFGGFLILTGLRLLHSAGKNDDGLPENSRLMRAIQRVIPSTHQLHGAHFFSNEGGRWLATPLFVALVLVELSDVVFALDSIPAIFAITLDPFVVFTSNVFAILGLRSLFFVVAGFAQKFRYLKVGLAGVLVFVGAKMLASDWIHVPAWLSLAIIALLLGLAFGISFLKSRSERARGEQDDRTVAPGHRPAHE